MRGRSGVPAQVRTPDETPARQALSRQGQLTKPAGALGRLEELSAWVCAVQGSCPPHQFSRIRVVIVAADHGIAAAGVSAYPPEVTAQMVANFAAGGAAVNVLARQAGATVRVVDDGVGAPVRPHRPRRRAVSQGVRRRVRARPRHRRRGGRQRLRPADPRRHGHRQHHPGRGTRRRHSRARAGGGRRARHRESTTPAGCARPPRSATRSPRARKSVGRDPEGLLRVVGGRDLATLPGCSSRPAPGAPR